jgi:hypothetical protein
MVRFQRLTDSNNEVYRVVYQARTISETCIMLISIAKFTETFSRLEEADKHKTEFLCRMSHELR